MYLKSFKRGEKVEKGTLTFIILEIWIQYKSRAECVRSNGPLIYVFEYLNTLKFFGDVMYFQVRLDFDKYPFQKKKKNTDMPFSGH